ncbi:MAG TPA: TDT family transporter [Solirubrobacteraceae bacterium]|jgi:C4-dicarboxylate transporter/malic acid transport protein|nr:TDT family transporter [Solirubrobacteraceae bacterium]
MRTTKLGPNWFAAVMGTGIVANAVALLPVTIPGLHAFAVAIWVLAAVLLVALAVATLVQWTAHADAARGTVSDPAMAQFYGAPAMALMTVGAGALLIGKSLIGAHAALITDGVLWSLGTIIGLATSAAIPLLLFTRQRIAREMTLPTWLMPIVPPMVSAANGAALVAHLPAGQASLTLLLLCYSMFGLSLVASLVIISLVWARLAYDGPGPAATVPTFWIVLGPLGQSITAANLLGAQAPHAIGAPYATAMRAMGVLYGVPIWGFAMLWLVIAATITTLTARRSLPFTMTWWSFTFPVGTVVTGTSELALHTHADVFTGAAVALYALLLVAWFAAAANTARGVLNGRLLGSARAIARSSVPAPAVPGATA